MHPLSHRVQTRLGLALLALCGLSACASAPPKLRADDPLESFNRKIYAFNDTLDRAVARPIVVGYRKITPQGLRTGVSNFFSNIRLPISMGNYLLQARPQQAWQEGERFMVNFTLGVGGFFDPASKMGIPLQKTDFGMTLARWGVGEGPFLMLPFLGPSDARDVWSYPVDSYLFDPLSYYARNHDFPYYQEYLPYVIYLMQLRESYLDTDQYLRTAYDPYAFMRDAWRQRRLYMLYDGKPPIEIIEQQQGVNDDDTDKLLQEQQQWENQQKK